MYHNRYQPQASHIAKKTTSAPSNNHNLNSNSDTSPALKSYQSTSSTNRQNLPSALVNSSLTSAAGPAPGLTSAATSETTANRSKLCGGGDFVNSSNNYRINYSTSAYSSPFCASSKQFVEERQDVIFRKVRGILNKITPETFDKLTKELVNVGLDSPRTLRGVIYLLFDKALKDLKYSSLYAKLCQELSEKAPNFEQDPGPNTFCRFLISKCEDEFERRRKATEDFDSKNELTDEEFEQKTIAKQKMLGNIKFICELGKKRLLQEEILHECIRGLLSKKKKERPIQDQAQDLECLCQIMRTIGSLLDVEASRNLMNQYFERIDILSRKPDLPSRIRFMLRDVIDLRNNNWRPRPYQREDNVPQPLSKLREELGYCDSSKGVSIDKLGNKNLMINNISKLSGNKLNSLLLDDEPTFTTTTDFHWGPTFLHDDSAFDLFSNSSRTTNNGASINVASSQSTNKLPVTHKAPDQNMFCNQKFGIGNSRIDPFLDSFNKNKFNRFDQANKDDVISRAIDSDPGGLNDDRRIRGSLKEPATQKMNPYFRGTSEHIGPLNTRSEVDGNYSHNSNISTSYSKDILDAAKEIPSRKDNIITYNKRPQYEDSTRAQASYHRVGGASPNLRYSNSKSNPDEPVQPPFPSPPPPLMHPKNLRDNHPVNQSFNHGPRHQHVHQPPAEHRDRRHVRSGLDRQQKFSVPAYRSPLGRERNHPIHTNQRDRIPESELSQNWRADKIAMPTPSRRSDIAAQQNETSQPSRLKTMTDKPSYLVTKLGVASEQQPRTKLDNRGGPLLNDPPDTEKVQDLVNTPAKKIITQSSTAPPLNELTSAGSRQDEPLNGVPCSTKISSNENSPLQANFIPSRPQNSRRHQEARPAGTFQARRGANQDKERRDTPRKTMGPPIEFDGRIFQRPYQNDSSSLDRRKAQFKPPIARNQSFDAPNAIDSKKPPIWRKDGIANNSTPSILRDSTTNAIPNSLLSKTTLKLVDSEFSLRPSHNLSGRTSTACNIPSTPKVTSIPANSSEASGQGISNHQSQTRDSKPPENRPIHDSKDNGEYLISAKSLPPTDKFLSVFSEIFKKDPIEINQIVAKIKELKIPKQHHTDCLVNTFKQIITKSDKDRENASRLLSFLIPSTFELTNLVNAFQDIFEQLQGLEVETPKVKSLVASLLGQTTTDGIVSLGDVSRLLVGGRHHPLFLLFLQKLESANGKAWLSEKFIASKVNLMDMLPEVDRSKDRLATILKDRRLGFLDPMLTIEPDLWEQMRDHDPSPAAIYRWIKENVDQSIQGTTTFAHMFVRCLLRFIHGTSMERVKNIAIEDADNGDSNSSNKSSPSNIVVQAISECEKELLSKYQHILQAILKDKSMQLASLYALQAFYCSLDFPKGALLRWFHLLYDMSIIDDEVYFIWKEEINDNYPGKGQALFQVNAWLQWLAEAESEEDEDD